MTIFAYAPNFDTEQAMYAIIFVAIMSYNLRIGFLKMFVDDEDDENYAPASVVTTVASVPVVTTVASVDRKSRKSFNKDDWDEICRTAIEKAKEGDHRARDWVVKNVGNFGNVFAATTSSSPADTTPKHTTSKSVIDDAVAFLRSMGHAKKDAVDRVNAAIKLKKYDNVEILIKDLYKKG